MKNKKIIVLIITIILLSIIGIIIYKNITKEKPEDILKTYIALLNEHKYEEMYNLTSEKTKSEISQEDFVKRNKNIYEGIDAVNIDIEIIDKEKENKIIKVKYNQDMYTAAGKIDFSNTVKIVKEHRQYKINWSTSMIFPKLRIVINLLQILKFYVLQEL